MLLLAYRQTYFIYWTMSYEALNNAEKVRLFILLTCYKKMESLFLKTYPEHEELAKQIYLKVIFPAELNNILNSSHVDFVINF